MEEKKIKNKIKAVRCDNCKFYKQTDDFRYEGHCAKDGEYTMSHRVCNKLPTDQDRREAKIKQRVIYIY